MAGSLALLALACVHDDDDDDDDDDGDDDRPNSLGCIISDSRLLTLAT
jgi:hypothetical protein